MENRSRLVVIALVAVLAVVGGFAAGAFLTGNRASPTEAPSGVAEVTDEPTDEPADTPTDEPTDAGSTEPSDEPTDEPSASATPAPAPGATITFTSLALDAADNPDGADRV